LHRQIGWFGALENLVDVVGRFAAKNMALSARVMILVFMNFLTLALCQREREFSRIQNQKNLQRRTGWAMRTEIELGTQTCSAGRKGSVLLISPLAIGCQGG
jgi:hypothetical protein